MSTQRALGSLYSDAVFAEGPQSKQPRLIILPQDDANEVGGVSEDLQIVATSPLTGETCSRRLLEAAGRWFTCRLVHTVGGVIMHM